MRGLQSIFSLSQRVYNKLFDTEARMLDLVYYRHLRTSDNLNEGLSQRSKAMGSILFLQKKNPTMKSTILECMQTYHFRLKFYAANVIFPCI